MAEAPNPLDRVDELMRNLAKAQAQILSINAEALTKYQEVDDLYSPRLNPLYREAQAIFDELHRLSDSHRDEMLVKDKKSSQRNSGLIGWRLNPIVIKHVETDELIRRIRALGQTVSRKLLRRHVTYELRMEALKAAVNQPLVASIDGLEVQRRDEFFAKPNNGIRMSTAHHLWPALDGLSGPKAIAVIMHGQED